MQETSSGQWWPEVKGRKLDSTVLMPSLSKKNTLQRTFRALYYSRDGNVTQTHIEQRLVAFVLFSQSVGQRHRKPFFFVHSIA